MTDVAANLSPTLLVRGGVSAAVRNSILGIEKVLVVSIVLIGAMLATEQARSAPVFDTSLVGSPNVRQSALAYSRGMAVDHMVHRLKSADAQSQIAEVNRFFNRFEYRSDIDLWGKWDYWASAVEFIERGAGDCEDFVIGKYTMLRALGVPDENLAITYVRDLRVNNWHMVLLYRPPGGGPALVLDGRTSEIQPLSERRDLVPVYGFNASEVMVLDRVGRSRTAASVSTAGHREWQRVLAAPSLSAFAAPDSEFRVSPIQSQSHFIKAGFRHQ